VQIHSAKDLIVYQRAYALSMRIFEATKRFPPEERFALTNQIRRSSHSICMNRREAWAKRMYAAHFVSMLTDCAGECGETDTSLDFAKDCNYIPDGEHRELVSLADEIGRMLNAMIFAPEKFLQNTPLNS
jgi:four helix bundle protein